MLLPNYSTESRNTNSVPVRGISDIVKLKGRGEVDPNSNLRSTHRGQRGPVTRRGPMSIQIGPAPDSPDLKRYYTKNTGRGTH